MNEKKTLISILYEFSNIFLFNLEKNSHKIGNRTIFNPYEYQNVINFFLEYTCIKNKSNHSNNKVILSVKDDNR